MSRVRGASKREMSAARSAVEPVAGPPAAEALRGAPQRGVPGTPLPGPLRLASLAAFPFPAPQGSQVFAREQARALERAGAAVTVVCYGRGSGTAPDDVALERSPAWLSPRSLRAGPNVAKPLADAALVATYVAAHRKQPFDLALAHNVEAAFVALAARPLLRVPVLYVAHTLMRHELSSYGPATLRPALDRAGETLDHSIARRADGVMVLCEAAAKQLGSLARGPLALIPPGLAPAPPPAAGEVARVCAAHGLAPGAFALYAGNPDGYQSLDTLRRAAPLLPELPVAVATHAGPVAERGPLHWLAVADAREARALLHGARIALLPRRAPGGFPIKLLNYMEAARPIVAREGLVGSLVHGLNAQLVPPDATPGAFVAAIRALLADPARARRLGEAARATLETQHAWPELARRTLAHAADVARAADPLHWLRSGASGSEQR